MIAFQYADDGSVGERVRVCNELHTLPFAPFVIPTGAQRSGGIWPTIGLTLPFETRFLRYVMLRLTPIANDKMNSCFFQRIIDVFLRRSRRRLR